MSVARPCCCSQSLAASACWLVRACSPATSPRPTTRSHWYARSSPSPSTPPLDITVQPAVAAAAKATPSSSRPTSSRHPLASSPGPSRTSRGTTVDNIDLDPGRAPRLNPDGRASRCTATDSTEPHRHQPPAATDRRAVPDRHRHPRRRSRRSARAHLRQPPPARPHRGLPTGAIWLAASPSIATITAPPSIPGASIARRWRRGRRSPRRTSSSTCAPDGVDLTSRSSRTNSRRLTRRRRATRRGAAREPDRVAQPQVPFDPSSRRSPADSSVFTQLRPRRRDSISSTGRAAECRSTVWMSPAPITTEGASMLRAQGRAPVVISRRPTYAGGGWQQLRGHRLLAAAEDPPAPATTRCR